MEEELAPHSIIGLLLLDTTDTAQNLHPVGLQSFLHVTEKEEPAPFCVTRVGVRFQEHPR